MWGTYRCVARFLLLAMLASAFGPLAMPCSVLPGALHCQRQQLATQSAQPAMPAMHCHHMILKPKLPQPEPPQADSAQATIQALDNCCGNHRCCCCDLTSEWARPAANLPVFVSLAIEPAYTSQNAVLRSIDIARQGSARAPPRS